jgi:hypothetical protein
MEIQVVEEEEEEEEVVVEQARPASPFAGLFGGPKAAAPAPVKEQPQPAPKAAPAAAAPPPFKKEEAPARAASPFAGLFGGGATLQVRGCAAAAAAARDCRIITCQGGAWFKPNNSTLQMLLILHTVTQCRQASS